MILCAKCEKRPAVVFVTRVEGEKTVNEGYCLSCAKELNIKPVTDMLDKFGVGDEELQQMEAQVGDMLGDELSDGGTEEENGFSQGGAPAFPFLQNLFGGTLRGEPQGMAAADEKKEKKDTRKKEKKRRFLNQYCTDLTKKAREGLTDPIIGREREIYRVTQILARRTKNNPCLIGEPGVGKTAVAEGLAQRIVDGEVPVRLQNREVFLLDLTALVAGTQFRGQFESRIKGLIEEVKAEGNIILFIDEVHSLVGTGDSEGSMSAANILKPALSRGEIQVIGATTFNEYRKYIEKDAALERRFQPVTVEESSVAETLEILKGIRQRYEEYHGVSLSDAVLSRAVTLSERYITDRFLPDKAIDLVDEASAAASLANKEAVRYAALQHECSALREREKTAMDAETVDYEQLANIRAELIKSEDEAKALEPTACHAAVTEGHLARVIELWTGIPAAKIQESELAKLTELEAHLRERVIGQDEAVRLVANAVRRSRVQISPQRRPASFIFVGPTGVGKTELVKVLAAELFDTPETLIRLDMSEFMEKHAVSRIIGSPPGYVGYDEAGQLTEKVRRKPYAVLLFDEIEKAHPDVMNILLQILDEGKVTDAHGRTVSFANTVIVMTSNAGSRFSESLLGFGKNEAEGGRDRAMKALREFLRPEFIGRVDEVVYFAPLSEESFEKIAVLMLEQLKQPLAEKGISFSFTADAARTLAQMSVGGKRGARDLRNAVRREAEDRIAALLVERFDALPRALTLATDADGKIVLKV